MLAASHKKRRVLVEVRPSLRDMLRLWLLKIQHPRSGWAPWSWAGRARGMAQAKRTLPH
jgi:hypothetical protein